MAFLGCRRFALVGAVMSAIAAVHAGPVDQFTPCFALQPGGALVGLAPPTANSKCRRAPTLKMNNAENGFPDECCGPKSHRKMPTWGADLPAWADTALAFAGAAGLLPLGIKVDEAMQDGMTRIDAIANEKTADGVRLFAAKPTDATEGVPVIVLIHQFFGLRPRDVGLCEELAARGYFGIAPDCYGGATTTYIPRAISLVLPAAIGGQWDPHLEAVDAVVDWARSQPGVDAENVFVAGFCFGGAVSARYSQWKPEKVKACGVFYGQPVSEGTGLPPVYAVYGDKDSQFPKEMVDEYEAELKRCGIQTEFRRYAEQGHAFVKDREAIRAGDAKDAWEGWLEFCTKARAQ